MVKHALGAGYLQGVRHHAGSDRDSRLVLLVAFAIWKEGQDGGDATGAGPSGGVEQKEQFHQVVVRVRLPGLDDEDLAAADVFLELDFDRTVRKCPRLHMRDRMVERPAHVAHELGV